jgi:predicted phosphodiesterase
VRIFHLTDLHISGEADALTRVKSRLSTLPEEFTAFDFIVVSGDLANSACAKEYVQVEQFLVSLIDRLKDGDPARIIIVPGNHDVDWQARYADKLAVGLWARTWRLFSRKHPVREIISTYEKGPEGCEHRVVHPMGGRLRAYKIDKHRYHLRFQNFYEFAQRFYARGRSKGRKPFDLDKPGVESHWSAHVFPDEEVVFYGINTCNANDEFLRGAHISEAATNEIRTHAKDKDRRSYLKIGVWHHGLTTRRGDRDYLTFAEAARLKSAGLDFGLHGHTHQDQAVDLGKVCHQTFVLISTGSFCADSSKRPGRVPNQASIISVEGRRMTWSLYGYRDSRWKLHEESQHALDGAAPVVQAGGVSRGRIGVHERKVTLGRDGIAELKVVLRDLDLEGKLTLASPLPGFGEITHVGNPTATFGADSIRPRVYEDKDAGLIRYFISSERGREHYDELSWAYYLSNGYALDAVDARVGRSRAQRDLRLQPNEDAYLYSVEAPTGELRIVFSLPEGMDHIGEARKIAQHRECPATPCSHWITAREDLERMTMSVGGNQISLTVQNPTVGVQYGFAFTLTGKRSFIPQSFLLLMDTVLRRCRDEYGADSEPLSGYLTRALKLAFDQELGGPDWIPPFWMAHLWSEAHQKLLPACGFFPASHWGSAYEYGEGVTGHAFRKSGAAVYKRDEGGNGRTIVDRSRLLYRPIEAPGENFEFVIALPILKNPPPLAGSSGTEPVAVGVIGFGGGRERGKAQDRLLKVASTVMDDESPDNESRRLLNRISRRASKVFWEAMATLDEEAAEHYRKNWQGDGDGPGQFTGP